MLANSSERYARLLVRLGALAGRELRVAHLETMRPWEQQTTCAAEESEDIDRVLIATARIEASTAMRGVLVRGN